MDNVEGFVLKMVQKFIDDNDKLEDFWPIDFKDSDQVDELVKETSKYYSIERDHFLQKMKTIYELQQKHGKSLPHQELKNLANEALKEEIDLLIKELSLWQSFAIHLASQWRLEQEYAKIDLEYSKK